MMDASPRTIFTLGGFVKTQGIAAQVAVQDFGGGSNAFGWPQVCFQNSHRDWTSFSKEIALPPGRHEHGPP